ncbi:MAG: carbamoyl-phosphate synthase large subunit, partial [Acidimicrobiaceae bacterium]|nr:carbamoyl-phosphate synthase large subunit [Acidimicrobiaceae bacterium]
MPRRDDIESILIIGSGPIVIGQACEFDYSGTQACRVLRAEGYRVILANSNPATIMTDPEVADATYVEPLDAAVLARIIERERPDALLPTLGGQTGLNLAMELVAGGVLEAGGVELIGADATAIATAEDRRLFKQAMVEIGLDVPRSGTARDLDAAREVMQRVGLPVIVRPAYILGGRGAGIAATAEEFERVAASGLEASPISEILIEESIVGWKEFELEVMRDRADNCVVVCSIENLDPMGVHTGDSITVAPAQTLSDPEYQQMRDAAFAVLRRVGVETGGSNVQFAVDPATGRQVVIEMNPRVSRSSALASKATGFPIAKIAARLAVGCTLDEIPNDITGVTPASFEPTLDYVVTKIPRWAFEKFRSAEGTLGTSMQSVGEAMAIGRTFCESLQKGLRSLEQGRLGLNADPAEAAVERLGDAELLAAAAVPTPERVFQLEALLRRGVSVEAVSAATGVDPWFLDQMARISEERLVIEATPPEAMTRAGWRRAKRLGFSDGQLAHLWGMAPADVRARREGAGVLPTFKTVDTCAAEFEATTPYHYSTYEDTDEIRPASRPRVVICGSGPNRIGQGVEFDYCCVHAGLALREAGYETVMVNCNPETVSTDYDANDRLYFEPLTAEDVANVIAAEDPVGVIVSLGGQTPLALSGDLPADLVLGTSPASIDLAEDRERWNALCSRLGIPQPPGGTATSLGEARQVAARIGYPALVRPSYVLGGRAMAIVYDDQELAAAIDELADSGSLGREGGPASQRPVLVDRFLEDATEVDVDAVRDCAGEVLIGAVMEHVEEAGVHSGDSACTIPPTTLGDDVVAVICDHTRRIAQELDVKGLLNVQFAVKRNGDSPLQMPTRWSGPGASDVFVIEANPRASRTVPFVAKATGVPLAMVAARLMVGATLADLREEGMLPEGMLPEAADGSAGVAGYVAASGYVAVKEVVLPFDRFPEADAVLGPEMRSTGEVMALDATPGLAFVKAQLAAGTRLPSEGTVFMSMADRDKEAGLRAARILHALGYQLAATVGTAEFLRRGGVPVAVEAAKLGDRQGRDAVDLIEAGQIQLVVNSPRGRGPRADGANIRSAAGAAGLPLVTTGAAALAAAHGLRDLR